MFNYIPPNMLPIKTKCCKPSFRFTLRKQIPAAASSLVSANICILAPRACQPASLPHESRAPRRGLSLAWLGFNWTANGISSCTCSKSWSPHTTTTTRHAYSWRRPDWQLCLANDGAKLSAAQLHCTTRFVFAFTLAYSSHQTASSFARRRIFDSVLEIHLKTFPKIFHKKCVIVLLYKHI